VSDGRQTGAGLRGDRGLGITGTVEVQRVRLLARIPEFGNRVLRVIVNGKKTPPHVVTVFFDRRRTGP